MRHLVHNSPTAARVLALANEFYLSKEAAAAEAAAAAAAGEAGGAVPGGALGGALDAEEVLAADELVLAHPAAHEGDLEVGLDAQVEGMLAGLADDRGGVEGLEQALAEGVRRGMPPVDPALNPWATAAPPSHERRRLLDRGLLPLMAAYSSQKDGEDREEVELAGEAMAAPDPLPGERPALAGAGDGHVRKKSINRLAGAGICTRQAGCRARISGGGLSPPSTVELGS